MLSSWHERPATADDLLRLELAERCNRHLHGLLSTMVTTTPAPKTEPASSARLSTPELRATNTGGGERSAVTGQPPAPLPLVLPPAAA